MSEPIGWVAQLWRYPVSSLTGTLLETAEVVRTGMAGDRRYGVVRLEDREPAEPSMTPWKTLVGVRSRLEGEALSIAVPGGGWRDAPSPEADADLSAYLGFPAALRPFDAEGPDGATAPFAFPRYDRAPIHLLTTASLARLKALHPQAVADVRRFRPNILVDMPEVEGQFPETEWIGRSLLLGEVRLIITEPCRRCGFTIIAQEGFDEDAEILRSLVRNNRSNIGVYCRVEEGGELRAGDSVRLAP